jgi:EpsI family protein
MLSWQRWIPAGAFAIGCLLLLSVQRQQAMALREPLESLPTEFSGYTGVDEVISEEEQAVAGMSDYVLRSFIRDSMLAFSVYVGYYEQQTQGRTIHSPRNCLPGAGWEALSASREPVPVGADTVLINRYELANGDNHALVYYWYQGRGRVESSEYKVKWDLLRDAALTGRSEEALVRIVVPINGLIEDPDALARSIAARMVPEVERRLPAPEA